MNAFKDFDTSKKKTNFVRKILISMEKTVTVFV